MTGFQGSQWGGRGAWGSMQGGCGGREMEMMDGGGADVMGFSSTVEGSSDGKSDGGTAVAMPILWETRII